MKPFSVSLRDDRAIQLRCYLICGWVGGIWIFVIEKMVIEWDLKHDPKDKESIPLTTEALKEVPTAIQRPIREAIMNDYFPNQTPAQDSSSG